MGVVSSKLYKTGWSGSGAVGERNTFEVQYLVETNDPNDGPRSAAMGALSSTPDPVASTWSVYSVGNDYDSGVRMMRRSTRHFSGIQTASGSRGDLWIVTNTYESPGNKEQQDTESNPLLRSTKYNVDWIHMTKKAEKDKDGEAIVNSAKQKFLDLVEVDDTRPVLVAVRNVATWQQIANLGLTYCNSINSSTWYGFPRWHCKVQSITSSELQSENDVQYYVQTIRIEIGQEDFLVRLVDQGMGYMEIEEGNGGWKYVVAKDKNDIPVSEPVMLNQPYGTYRDKFDAYGNPQPGLYREIHVYKELDFAGLGI